MTTIHRPDISASMTATANASRSGYYGVVPEPKYFVHVYNIAPKIHNISRTLFPRFTAPACPAGQRYLKVTSIRHPFLELDHESDDTSQIRLREHIAERVAMDLCNPENTTLDQNHIVVDSFSIDGNLNLQGLFWSRNDPPTEEELKAAETRLENYYRGCLSKAIALERASPKELMDRLIPDWHDAAEYFNEDYSWHPKHVKRVESVAKVDCPNCGEPIKAGLAYHKTEEGVCVLDWKRAVESGIKKKADVPEGREWWTPEVTAVKESKSVKA